MAMAVALIVSPICRVHLQWVPFRCGVDSNEGTDTVAKEAAALPQARVAADVRACAAARAACGRGRPLEALNMHQLHAGHWSGSGHNNISAGSERTPPRSASSAQTIPALRAGVSRVVRRKAPSVASFFGARPLGELWDGAFCGSAPSFPVRRRTVRSEVADRRDRDLVITVETVISEVAQFITC